MPTLKRQPPAPAPNPETVYVAWQSFWYGDHLVRRGERLRGDHPTTQAWFGAFVPDGTPESEWPTIYDQVRAEQDKRDAEEIAARKVKLTVPPQPQVMVCTTEIVRVLGGNRASTIVRGSEAYEDDPVVLEHPDCWRPK